MTGWSSSPSSSTTTGLSYYLSAKGNAVSAVLGGISDRWKEKSQKIWRLGDAEKRGGCTETAAREKKRRGYILLSASRVIRTRCLSALSLPEACFHSDSFPQPVFIEGFRHRTSLSPLR